MVLRIARWGRAFGFRLISITQRLAKLNKDVLC
jgi:DNA helicase HerA-like ATPase